MIHAYSNSREGQEDHLYKKMSWKTKKEERSTWMRLYFPATIAFFISLSNNALATTHIKSQACNTGFIGVVKEKLETSAPFSSIPMVKVTFQIEDGPDEYTLKVIKNDLHPFDVGARFKVVAHDGLACSFKKI